MVAPVAYRVRGFLGLGECDEVGAKADATQSPGLLRHTLELFFLFLGPGRSK